MLIYLKLNGGQYMKDTMAQPNGVWDSSIHLLRNFSFFAAILCFFKIFTHFQMALKQGKLDRRLFPASPYVRVDFSLQKKKKQQQKQKKKN